MIDRVPEITPRLTPDYLKVYGWKTPNPKVPQELVEVARLIPASLKDGETAKWIGIKQDSSPGLGDLLTTYHFSFLFDRETDSPLVKLFENEYRSTDFLTEYNPRNTDRRKIDPSELLKDAQELPHLRDNIYPSTRYIHAQSLGIYEDGPFLTRDALISFFDPHLVVDEISHFVGVEFKDEDAPQDDQAGIQKIPKFNLKTNSVQPDQVKNRYMIGENARVSFPHGYGQELKKRRPNEPEWLPASSVSTMLVNTNYFEVNISVADITSEFRLRVTSANVRYPEKAEELDQTIAQLQEELVRLTGLKASLGEAAVERHIKTQSALFKKLGKFPLLFQYKNLLKDTTDTF